MFGGSTTWGYGSRDDFTTPSLVSKRLAENGLNAEVVNYGVNGDRSTQSMIRFLLELRRGNIPDLVIFYGGHMDIFSAFLAKNPDTPFLPLRDTYLKKITSLRKTNNHTYQFLADYIRETSSLLSISGSISKIFTENDKTISKSEEVESNVQLKRNQEVLSQELLDIYFSNINFIRKISKSYAFNTLFYWEPGIHDKKYKTEYENQRFIEMNKALPEFHSFYAITGIKLDDGKNHSLSSNGVRDLRLTFSDTKTPIYIDGYHYGEAGNQYISKIISSDILSMYPVANSL